MPVPTPQLSDVEQKLLYDHLRKHIVYPFGYRVNKVLSNANFGTVEAAGLCRYTTLTFRPKRTVGVVAIMANFIITPNTVVDTFGFEISYSSTFSLADNANSTLPDEEAKSSYMLLSQGGAINDLQVFFPLNFLVEANSPLYIHLFVGTASISASNTMIGKIKLGTLRTEKQ